MTHSAHFRCLQQHTRTGSSEVSMGQRPKIPSFTAAEAFLMKETMSVKVNYTVEINQIHTQWSFDKSAAQKCSIRSDGPQR